MAFSRSLQQAGLCAGFALGTFVYGANAQTPAGGTSPALVVASVPKPDCGVKPEHPGRLASNRQKSTWRAEATNYLECLRKYAEDLQSVAAKYQEVANAAVAQFNASNQEMQAAVKAAAE